jgi:SAM-dependent methyltransferase
MRQTTRLPTGATVLISGCAENLLNLELASLGYKVVGLDERECRDDHPNFKFLEGSRTAPSLAAASVDAVIAIGGVGHASPGALVVSAPDEADLAAMQAWRRVLKPGGALILTIPFGKATPTAFKQLYDSVPLDNLLKGWTVEVREFALCTPQHGWFYPAPEAEAARAMVSQTGRPQSVALVCARK